MQPDKKGKTGQVSVIGNDRISIKQKQAEDSEKVLNIRKLLTNTMGAGQCRAWKWETERDVMTFTAIVATRN